MSATRNMGSATAGKRQCDVAMATLSRIPVDAHTGGEHGSLQIYF